MTGEPWVLVYGLRGDPMVQLVRDRLAERGARVLEVDESQRPATREWTLWSRDEALKGGVGDQDTWYDWADLTGAFVRPSDHRGARPWSELTPEQAGAVATEWRGAWATLLDLVPCPVLNRPSVGASNDAKPYQTLALRSLGAHTPPTWVTDDPEVVDQLAREVPQGLVYKSISGQRSVVRRLEAGDFDRLVTIRNCPTQFQQYVPGGDVRVHVVGDRCFAAQITSSAVDYRYAHRDGEEVTMRACDLPPEIERLCVEATRDAGLLLAGIDWRLDPEGRWWALEVNPAPAFAWFERAAALPISGAVADLLCSPSHPEIG